jgi:hypothetical protein
MRKLVGLGVLAVLSVACVDELAEGAGEMLVDAGELLADAGSALVDAGNDSAQAQQDAGQLPAKAETLEVACDRAYKTVTSVRENSGQAPYGVNEVTRMTRTEYFAEVDASTPLGVDAWICGHARSVPSPDKLCDDKTAGKCVVSADPTPEILCQQAGALLIEGKVRIPCGYEHITAVAPRDGMTFPEQVTVDRWATARITIRR